MILFALTSFLFIFFSLFMGFLKYFVAYPFNNYSPYSISGDMYDFFMMGSHLYSPFFIYLSALLILLLIVLKEIKTKNNKENQEQKEDTENKK